MKKIENDISICVCGAVTVTLEGTGVTKAMRLETFKEKFGDPKNYKVYDYYNCNHCVNGWGIDICSCGSCLPVEECECDSNTTYDSLE